MLFVNRIRHEDRNTKKKKAFPRKTTGTPFSKIYGYFRRRRIPANAITPNPAIKPKADGSGIE